MITPSSAYATSEVTRDEDGRVYLTEREPLEFRERFDTIVHVVKTGDTLFTIADLYYQGVGGIDEPAWYWWAIGDFQPEPVHDPTVPLTTGTYIYVPAAAALLEALSPERAAREALLR